MTIKEDFLEENNLKEEGWSVSIDGMFVCPHGHRVEVDGNCPKGCESPVNI